MPTKVLIFGDVPPPFFRGTGPVFPDQELVSWDDEQVKAILLKMDIHALFTPPISTKQNLVTVTDDRHPTHRFVFARWMGQKKERDNGYMMMGYRRSHYSEADFIKAAKEFVETISVLGTIRNISNKGHQ